MENHEIILFFEVDLMNQTSNAPFSDAIANSHLSLPLAK